MVFFKTKSYYNIRQKRTRSIILKVSRGAYICPQTQWCSRKYLGTGAVQNISMVLFLERVH